MFYALAIVCDDFFVPSLEKICEVSTLHATLSEVAAASMRSWAVLAAGVCTPREKADICTEAASVRLEVQDASGQLDSDLQLVIMLLLLVSLGVCGHLVPGHLAIHNPWMSKSRA